MEGDKRSNRLGADIRNRSTIFEYFLTFCLTQFFNMRLKRWAQIPNHIPVLKATRKLQMHCKLRLELFFLRLRDISPTHST
jgi:hypothetical protein